MNSPEHKTEKVLICNGAIGYCWTNPGSIFPTLHQQQIQLINCVRLNLLVLGQESLARMRKRVAPDGDSGPSKAAKLANPWATKVYDYAKRLGSTVNFKAQI